MKLKKSEYEAAWPSIRPPVRGVRLASRAFLRGLARDEMPGYEEARAVLEGLYLGQLHGERASVAETLPPLTNSLWRLTRSVGTFLGAVDQLNALPGFWQAYGRFVAQVICWGAGRLLYPKLRQYIHLWTALRLRTVLAPSEDLFDRRCKDFEAALIAFLRIGAKFDQQAEQLGVQADV